MEEKLDREELSETAFEELELALVKRLRHVTTQMREASGRKIRKEDCAIEELAQLTG